MSPTRKCSASADHLMLIDSVPIASGNLKNKSRALVCTGVWCNLPWELEDINPGVHCVRPRANKNIKEVPEDINRMKSLSYLNLSYNQLTKLPSALKELPLARLDLSNNDFSEEERKRIENWFNGKCKILW